MNVRTKKKQNSTPLRLYSKKQNEAMGLSITLNHGSKLFWVMNSFENLMKATDLLSAENKTKFRINPRAS